MVKQSDVPILIVIDQITPIYLDCSIPEPYLGVLKKFMARGGLKVKTTPDGEGAPEVGYLSFVDNTGDSTAGTIKRKGTFANPDHRL
jgi:hypothetical protein